MKAPKYVLAALAVSFSLSAFSQQESQKTQKTDQEKKEAKASSWGVYPPPAQQPDSASLMDAQSRAGQQSFPAPNFGSYYIPVLGSYSSAVGDNQKQIIITGDEKNAGKVWIEGIAPVKIYALLKAAPGTYKIPAQKNAAEGTVIYDETTEQVSICVGCGFKEKDPAAVIANFKAPKSKGKAVRNFTGVKTDQGTVSNR